MIIISNKKRVAVLGLDGLDWLLLKKLFNRSSMPFLKNSLNKTVQSKIYTYPPYTPPMWISLETGVSPGKHCIFDLYNLHSGKLFTFYDIKYPRIWHILKMNKLKSFVLGVFLEDPKLYHGREIIIIADRISPKFLATPNTYVHKLFDMGYIPQYLLLRYAHINRETYKESLLKYLEVLRGFLETYNYLFDLCRLELAIPDEIMHIFPENVYQGYFDDIFVRIDKLLRTLTNNFDLSIIISDHGFRPLFKINLALLFYIFGVENLKYNSISSLIQKGIKTLLEHAFNTECKNVRKATAILLQNNYLRRGLRKVLQKIKLDLPLQPDSKSSLFYMYQVAPSNSRYLMLGGVGKKLHANLRVKFINLIKGLDGIKDVVEGKSFFHVHRSSACTNGTPDYIVITEDGYGLSQIHEPYISLGFDHYHEAVFIAMGDGILPYEINSIMPYDIVPTILAYMNLSIPAYSNGKIISEIAPNVYVRRVNYINKWHILRKILSIKSKTIP